MHTSSIFIGMSLVKCLNETVDRQELPRTAIGMDRSIALRHSPRSPTMCFLGSGLRQVVKEHRLTNQFGDVADVQSSHQTVSMHLDRLRTDL